MPRQHIVEPKYISHLEDATIQMHANSYPEEVRESFIWLARYIREKCRKNLDVLVEKLRKLGFTTTAGPISKILQGRWVKDSNGKATPPVIAFANFVQQVEKLRDEEKKGRLAGKIPFIETSTYTDIADYIDIRRAPDTVCKFGLILGPTGAQKSESFKHYAEEVGEDLITHIEAPDTPTMTKFITDLAERFGVARTATHHAKVQKIRENVTEGRCLIIDNVQRLYKPGKGWNQPIFNYVQKLQDEKGCAVILCAVTDFKRTISEGGYFEQFEGRCGGEDEFLIQPEFAPRADLILIAEAFGLRPTKATIKFMEELSRKKGRIRVLFNKLQKAKRLADATKQKLTIELLEEVCAAPAPIDESELPED